MRRFGLGLLAILGLAAFSSEANAQLFGGINDPALAYYGLYLPRQQVQAMTPGPEATLNQVAAQRQYYAATNRSGFNDTTMFGDPFDTETEVGAKRRSQPSRRMGAVQNAKFGAHGGNLNGLGPPGYFDRSRLTTYYRGLQQGRGKNLNVSVTSPRRGMSGYGGVGGLPGPR